MSAISLDGVSFAPSFDPDILSYTATVSYLTDTTKVNVTNDDTYIVKVNGTQIGHSEFANLIVGSNTITVKVDTVTTYTFTITREATYQISCPENIDITDDILTFDSVDYATGYEALINDTDTLTVTSGMNLYDEIPTVSSYSIKIKAIGDGSVYLDSEYSSSVTFTRENFSGISISSGNTDNDEQVESVSSGAGNNFTVNVPLALLEAYESSNPSQTGDSKWLAMLVDTGFDSIIGTYYGSYAFATADVNEASAVGGSAGQFVLWIRAEEVESTMKTFTLSKAGYVPVTVNIDVTDTTTDQKMIDFCAEQMTSSLSSDDNVVTAVVENPSAVPSELSGYQVDGKITSDVAFPSGASITSITYNGSSIPTSGLDLSGLTEVYLSELLGAGVSTRPDITTSTGITDNWVITLDIPEAFSATITSATIVSNDSFSTESELVSDDCAFTTGTSEIEVTSSTAGAEEQGMIADVSGTITMYEDDLIAVLFQFAESVNIVGTPKVYMTPDGGSEIELGSVIQNPEDDTQVGVMASETLTTGNYSVRLPAGAVQNAELVDNAEYTVSVVVNEVVQLATPTISLDGDTLSWGSVANADHYDIAVLSDGETEPTHYSYQPSPTDLTTLSIAPVGTKTITVIARAEDNAYAYSDSEQSNSVTYEYIGTQLDTPVASLAGDIFSWNQNNFADGHLVKVVNSSLVETTYSIAVGELNEFDLSAQGLASDTYQVSVKAVGDGIIYSDSEYSTEETYEGLLPLDTPVISLSGDTLTWSDVANGDEFTTYTLRALAVGNSANDRAESFMESPLDLTTLGLADDDYNISVMTVSGSRPNSDYSNVVSYTVTSSASIEATGSIAIGGAEEQGMIADVSGTITMYEDDINGIIFQFAESVSLVGTPKGYITPSGGSEIELGSLLLNPEDDTQVFAQCSSPMALSADTYSVRLPAGAAQNSALVDNAEYTVSIVVNEVMQLATPTISLDGDTLSWGSVANADHYDIAVLSDGETEPTHYSYQPSPTDLTTLSIAPVGTKTITVIARAEDNAYAYSDSEYSNSVSYTVS